MVTELHRHGRARCGADARPSIARRRGRDGAGATSRRRGNASPSCATPSAPTSTSSICLHTRRTCDSSPVPADLDGADLVILPGSKHVAADLAWLRREGFDGVVRAALARGARVMGICGGAMMLGARIDDPQGVEGAANGLDILRLDTAMDPDKITRRTTVEFGDLPDEWRLLDGRRAVGYEIRNGRVTAHGCATSDARVWASGRVLATTVHGLLEDPDVLDALVGVRPPPVLDATFDALADAVDEYLDTDRLWAMVRG